MPRTILQSLLVAVLFATMPKTHAATFSDGEQLSYEVTWPSGLGLGQTSFLARATIEGWDFRMSVQASLPILEIQDKYHAKATTELCSTEFSKNTIRGQKKAQEQIRFDQRDHKATRSTVTGGKNTFPIPPCARDSLTFLYFLREQLAAGRIPPPDDVYFGAQYQVVLTYLETRNIEVANTLHLTDRILIDIQGPKSELNFEIFFSKDEARIPLLIRIPFEAGTFSLRLVQ